MKMISRYLLIIMSNNLLKHYDYGSYDDLSFLLSDVLAFNDPKPIRDVKSFCKERSMSLSYSIDAAIDIFAFIGWIDIVGDLLQPTRVSEITNYKEDEEKIKELLIDAIISKLKETDLLQSFILLDSIKYDISNDGIVLRNHMIPIEFSGLRNLLYELGLFNKHVSPTLIKINENYTNYFINQIALWIKEQVLRDIQSTTLSYEQFLQIQEIKNKYGTEAEKFVLEYERSRLISHPDCKKVKIISNIDVGAGFDIISFNNKSSRVFDRFIEVKSYSEDLQFYWSRNEVRVAEVKNEHYFLYLVNRNHLEDDGYSPTMIQNPYHTIFEDDTWLKNAETWIVKPSHSH